MSDELVDILTDAELLGIEDRDPDAPNDEIPVEDTQEIPAQPAPDASQGDIYSELQRRGLRPEDVQYFRERTVSKTDFVKELQARDNQIAAAQDWINKAAPMLQQLQQQQVKDPVESLLDEMAPEMPQEQKEFLRRFGDGIAHRIRQEVQPIKQTQDTQRFESMWSQMAAGLRQKYGDDVAQFEPELRRQFLNYQGQGGVVHPDTIFTMNFPQEAERLYRKRIQAVGSTTPKSGTMEGFQAKANPQVPQNGTARRSKPVFKDPVRDLMSEADMIFAESFRK